MKIRTIVERKVTVWESQEVIVEVDSIEEFERLKKIDRLEANAIDWLDSETLWETVEDTGEYDNSQSEIEEIIEED